MKPVIRSWGLEAVDDGGNVELGAAQEMRRGLFDLIDRVEKINGWEILKVKSNA